MDIKVREFPLTKSGLIEIDKYDFSKQWPVVYILHDKRNAYIGQTVNISRRAKEHKQKITKNKLNRLVIITSKDFNRSVIVDYERKLLELIHGDLDARDSESNEVNYSLKLLNGNLGEIPHNYFDRERYTKNFVNLWKQLQIKNLVNINYEEVFNTIPYKFSPFKVMTSNQFEIAGKILYDLYDALHNKEKKTYIVDGGPGTGKSLMAVQMLQQINDVMNNEYDLFEYEYLINQRGYINALLKLKNEFSNLKIAIVISMAPFRKTMKEAVKKINGLSSKMVIGPSSLNKENEYDILIVDEAHRLRRYNNINDRKSFSDKNAKLKFNNEEGNQLKWVLKCSRIQILFYDKDQSVRPSDVPREEFRKIENLPTTFKGSLELQLRCKGGNTYVNYIKDIFLNTCKPKSLHSFREYEFFLYDDINKMVKDIQAKDRKVGLSRIVAGYAWKWIGKSKTYTEKYDQELFDIEITSYDGNEEKTYKGIWNTQRDDWVNSQHAIDEVGCIHTIQGYDLNYVGVIIGNDIYYDEQEKKIKIKKENYYDRNGKVGVLNEKELSEYILRIYYVLLTRGINGTYIYACDKALYTYLTKFIKCKCET